MSMWQKERGRPAMRNLRPGWCIGSPAKRASTWMMATALVLMIAGLLVACGGSDDSAAADPTPTASMTALEIDAADYSFTSLDEIPAGWVEVNFSNSGKEMHHAQLARLNDGVTMEQFEETLHHDEIAALQLVTLTGGAATIDPGGSGQVLLNLAEGEYVLICLVPNSDGGTHVDKGMIKSLTVTPATAGGGPEPVQTISMHDFAFEFPATLPSGPVLYEVVNDGPQPHEIAVLKLNDDVTTDEALEILSGSQAPDGPPPFQWAGGMQALSANESGIMHLDLEPGMYVAVCMVPDPATGNPHIALGMVKEFTVE